jgi:hypothetical protein
LSDDGQFLVLPVAAPAVCDWRLVADVPVTTALRVRSNSPDDPTAESGGYSLPMNDQFAALRGEADGAVRLGGRLSRYRPRRRASVCFWSRPSSRVAHKNIQRTITIVIADTIARMILAATLRAFIHADDPTTTLSYKWKPDSALLSGNRSFSRPQSGSHRSLSRRRSSRRDR